MISNVILQYGAVFIPLGFVLLVLSLEYTEDWKFCIGVAISILFFVLGIWAFREAMKIAKAEQAESRGNFEKLMGELHSFHQYMANKGGSDARDKDNRDTNL